MAHCAPPPLFVDTFEELIVFIFLVSLLGGAGAMLFTIHSQNDVAIFSHTNFFIFPPSNADPSPPSAVLVKSISIVHNGYAVAANSTQSEIAFCLLYSFR